jgi:hypothetical protein
MTGTACFRTVILSILIAAPLLIQKFLAALPASPIDVHTAIQVYTLYA